MINYTQLRWTWINPSDKTLNGLSSMISEKKIYFEEKRINFEKKILLSAIAATFDFF